MRVVEKEGKNEEEAIKLALEELGAKREEVKIEYLESAKSSFLGLGVTKPAKVRVYYIEETGKKAIEVLKQIFNKMGFKVEVILKEETDSEIRIELKTSESSQIIGKFGRMLQAIQIITNAIINSKREHPIKVMIDIAGYREKRIDSLKKLAKNIANSVKETGRARILQPMNSYERRIIHMALQDDKDVETYSIGTGPLKKIKISLKGTSQLR